jgi:hypothetical protein
MVQTVDIISNKFNVASRLTGAIVRQSANTNMLKFIAIPINLPLFNFTFFLSHNQYTE